MSDRDKIHPVVEAAARRMCARRHNIPLGHDHVNLEWPNYVQGALAALQTFEPLLVKAFDKGWDVGRALDKRDSPAKVRGAFVANIIHQLTKDQQG